MASELKAQTGQALLVLSEQPPDFNAISNKTAMKWVMISTVLDSGAVRHVTPNGVFSLTVSESERSRDGHKYYGPAGEPITNLGTQSVKGTTEEGQPLAVGFDVANFTRPLASVSEIAKKQFRVVFDDDGSYIQNKKSGKRIAVNQEGNLYVLDLWVQVPEPLSQLPFVGQVS